MNVREHIRAQMGEAGVKHYDECRRVQEKLHGELRGLIEASVLRIGPEPDAAMSGMMLMSILEAASCAFADTVVAASMTLAEQDLTHSRQSIIHTSIKSLIAHLKEGFEHCDAIASGVADKIKEAARKGTDA